jgi:hypothetical protein
LRFELQLNSLFVYETNQNVAFRSSLCRRSRHLERCEKHNEQRRKVEHQLISQTDIIGERFEVRRTNLTNSTVIFGGKINDEQIAD